MNNAYQLSHILLKTNTSRTRKGEITWGRGKGAEREKETERDRETDSDRDTERHRDTDRQKERQR